MTERDEEPTRPGTPEAIKATRTASGSFELPRELVVALFEAKLAVMGQRLAVVESDAAQARAHCVMLEREIDKLRAEVRGRKALAVVEVGPVKGDRRSE
jgi:hypothetical protein